MRVSNCQPGKDDSQALVRALSWQVPGFRPWRGLAGSALLHALLALPFIGAAISFIPARASGPPPKTIAMPLFTPGKGDSPPQRRRIAMPPVLSLRATAPLAASMPELPDMKIDLNSIRLSFAPDLRNELPQVVQDQHGMLALLDKEDRTVAHCLVRPPAWEMEEKIQDVSRSLRILMDPPEKWVVFRNVAKKYGIDLSRYQACALFDLGFRHCLKNAILAKASAAPAHSGRVRSARLAIAADRPCGIEVLEVSFAAN